MFARTGVVEVNIMFMIFLFVCDIVMIFRALIAKVKEALLNISLDHITH